MKKPSSDLIDSPPHYRLLTYCLLTAVVILAITAGYFHQLYLLENKRYKKIEDQFVRVRSQLGKDKTNQLIEESYQIQAP